MVTSAIPVGEEIVLLVAVSIAPKRAIKITSWSIAGLWVDFAIVELTATKLLSARPTAWEESMLSSLSIVAIPASLKGTLAAATSA